MYEGNSNVACDVANKTIDQINIYLSDNLSYDLSLYGLEWNLTLIVQEIGTYKTDQLLTMQDEQPIQQDNIALLKELENLKKELEKYKMDN